MKKRKLENYLRAHRRRAGLTQREVAFLTGCRNSGQISRYEKRRRLPPLETALAWEAILGVPISELFAGVTEEIREDVNQCLRELECKLETEDGKYSRKRDERKLRWLKERQSAADNLAGKRLTCEV